MYYNSNATIQNSRIEGNIYGIYMYNNGYTNVQILNNKIVKFYDYGIFAEYTRGNVYSGNTFDSSNYHFFGLYSELESGVTITNNRFNNCAIYLYEPNVLSTATTTNVSNNFVATNLSGAEYGIYGYLPFDNVSITHNTVYVGPGGSVYYGFYTNNSVSSPKNMVFMNNVLDLEGTASSASVSMSGSAKSWTKIDGNDYYTGSAGSLAYSFSYFGTIYSTYSAFRSAMSAAGFETYGNNLKPTFVNAAAYDLHYNQSVPNPSGSYAGVDVDIDGDSRCKLFPSAGADESNYGKSTKPSPKFFGPATIYNAAPTVFYNTSKVGTPQTYKWYVNGKYVSDSISLSTQLAVYPSVTIKLVETNCAGSDSSTQTFSVSYPSAPPVSDFISDKNAIKVNDIVHFSDLSTNGANDWQWTITPDTTISFGVRVPAYKYIYGSSTSQNPQIQFLASGYYKVCLTASNVLSGGKVGKGATNCKTNYIHVLPAINMGTLTTITEPIGYLYDDGGPSGNYYNPKGSVNAVQGITIDACADSTYLIFKSFNLECGYDYLKVYDGADNSGKLLSKCSGTAGGTGSSGMGPGLTGGPSSSCTYLCTPAQTDTFKAGKKMFIEMDIDPNTVYSGFEAYWWTKHRTEPKPKADFTSSQSAHHDSICAGGVITFTNTSTGNDLTYAWELDGDYSDGYETTTQNASWLWLFPTEAPVTLVTTNCGGPDTITKIVHVFAPAAPVANFKADNTNPTLNDLVFLTSTVPQCVDDYKWTVVKTYASSTDTGHAQFALGTSASNSSPALMFTDTGYYTITLFVDNGGGAAKDQITKTAYIYVKAGYCIPSVAQLNSGLGITSVRFNGINNSSSQGVTDYTSYVNNQSLSTTLELGVSYPISIQRDSPFYEAETRAIFIDWNRDGSFESNEVVAVDSNDATNATWSTMIKVPKTANIGATIMRIAANRGSYTNYPCGQNQYGEYEDYRLYVRPDQTPPVIYLKEKDSMQLEQGYTFAEPGDSAFDNLNGNITANITSTSNKPNSFKLNRPALVPGDYIISYNVSDSSGNAAVTRYRYIKVLPDTGKPDLEVAGPDTTFVLVNKSSTGYATLPGIISSEDLVDGTTVDTIAPMNIPINKLDTVVVMYSTSDQTGNRTVVYRYVVIYDNVAPVLSLIGKQTQYVPVNTAYTDSGADPKDNYYTPTELRPLIQTKGSVDMSKLGTYTITYSLTDPSGNSATPVTRTVNVVDTSAPVLVLNGNKSDTIEVDSIYTDMGVAISDNYYTGLKAVKTGTYYTTFSDGRATKLGTYTIVYTVTDPSGNKASVTRFVTVVDRIAPEIMLLGNSSVSICRWANYKDSGYIVHDNYYTTVKVDTEGSFITKHGATIQGLYSLRYKATDGSGNVSFSDYRYIYVRPADDQLCLSGIKEGLQLDKYINVYPNPTSGVLNITANLPNEERVVMTITNALGQTIASVDNAALGQNSFTIDLSSQPSGMYMLNVISSHDKATKQIMLTR
jgi:PKD repeat protein